jgi:hypothetical protein
MPTTADLVLIGVLGQIIEMLTNKKKTPPKLDQQSIWCRGSSAVPPNNRGVRQILSSIFDVGKLPCNAQWACTANSNLCNVHMFHINLLLFLATKHMFHINRAT